MGVTMYNNNQIVARLCFKCIFICRLQPYPLDNKPGAEVIENLSKRILALGNFFNYS